MGMSDQRHAPVALPPAMTRLGRPQGRFGPFTEYIASTGFRSTDHPARTDRNLKLTSDHSEAKNAWNNTSSTPPRLHAVVLIEQEQKIVVQRV
jgi:hypothetical protein